MKLQNILLSIAFLFFQQQIKAQLLDHSPQIRMGIIGGYNSASATDVISGNIEFSDIPGFHIGVTTDIHLIEKFSLEPILLMNRKGFEALFPDSNNTSFALDYLSLQLLAKYHILKGLKIFVGGESSLLANVTASNSQFIDPAIFNTADFSFLSGIEIAPFKTLSIHAKYNLGLNSILDFTATDENGNPIGDSSFKNRVIMLGFTFYPFRFEVM